MQPAIFRISAAGCACCCGACAWQCGSCGMRQGVARLRESPAVRKSLGLVPDLHVDFSSQLEPGQLVAVASRRYTLGRLSGCMTFELSAIDDSCGVVAWRGGRVSLRLRLLLFRRLALLVLALPRGHTSFASSGSTFAAGWRCTDRLDVVG